MDQRQRPADLLTAMLASVVEQYRRQCSLCQGTKVMPVDPHHAKVSYVDGVLRVSYDEVQPCSTCKGIGTQGLSPFDKEISETMFMTVIQHAVFHRQLGEIALLDETLDWGKEYIHRCMKARMESMPDDERQKLASLVANSEAMVAGMAMIGLDPSSLVPPATSTSSALTDAELHELGLSDDEATDDATTDTPVQEET